MVQLYLNFLCKITMVMSAYTQRSITLNKTSHCNILENYFFFEFNILGIHNRNNSNMGQYLKKYDRNLKINCNSKHRLMKVGYLRIICFWFITQNTVNT